MSHRTPCRDRPGQNAWLANTNSHVAADAIGAKSAHGRVDATARGGAGGGGASQPSCNSLAIPESFSRRLGWAGPLGGLEDSPLGNTPRTSECSRKIQTPACMFCRMSAPNLAKLGPKALFARSAIQSRVISLYFHLEKLQACMHICFSRPVLLSSPCLIGRLPLVQCISGRSIGISRPPIQCKLP